MVLQHHIQKDNTYVFHACYKSREVISTNHIPITDGQLQKGYTMKKSGFIFSTNSSDIASMNYAGKSADFSLLHKKFT